MGMFSDSGFASSPSRTYVAICNRSNFDGYYFRKFHLPKGVDEGGYSRILPNDPSSAAWFFLNHLNLVACIDTCIPWEQFTDLKDQDEIRAQGEQEYLRFWG